MRPSNIVLALLLGVLALLVLSLAIAWVMPEPEGVGGSRHPEYSTMQQGGSGAARHGSILGVGWAFGALSIVIFVLIIVFACRRPDQFRQAAPYFLASFLIYLAVFTWLVVAYSQHMDEPTARLYLGFPLSTAIMLYLFFPVSIAFNVLFVVGFRRWVLIEEDEARFEHLLELRRELAASGEGD